ncbi:MAG: nucleotidyltransferase family protein [Traorella sp.]
MKTSEKVFLEIMKKALAAQPLDSSFEDFKEWNEVYQLSETHQVAPLIYEASYKYIQPNEIKQIWKRQMMIQTTLQIQRTMEFKRIYSILLENNICPFVFKGIICRNTYPNPDLRISNDEDILIKKEDLLKVNQIFLDLGYEADKKLSEDSDEIGYHHLKNGSYIEVHTELFAHDSVYSFLNDEFKDVFNDTYEVSINEMTYYTFKPTLSLFYLFTHAYKHFVHGGFGLRQVSDMMMFMNKYADEIDYDLLNSWMKKYHFESFWFNLLDIAEKYLGFSFVQVHYHPSQLKLDSNDLLCDLLDSGIYGKSSMERLHSSNMTLSALNHTSVSQSIFNSLFPSISYIKNHYAYVDKCILLLPIGYIHRMINYLKNKKQNKASNSIELGKKRIELLKKYELIN